MNYKFESDFHKREWLGRVSLKDMSIKFPHIKLLSNEIHYTEDYYCPYDAFSFIFDENYSIKKRIYFEIKVRNQIYSDGMILERSKVKHINNVIKDSSILRGEYKIFYINFIENKSTLIWDITDIKESDCNEVAKFNKATSVSKENKIDKRHMMLDPMEAKGIDYIYNEQMALLNFYVPKYLVPKIEKKEIGFDL
jgi:hypothetical protein